MKKTTILAIVVLTLFAACTKNNISPDYNTNKLANLSIEFDNIVGNRTLTFNNTLNAYKNAKSEDFTISAVKYFISNVTATTVNGQKFAVNQDSSYFLIDALDKSTRFANVKVPEGDYSQISFTLGVDSLRSTMPVDKRTGALDPATNGMYWSWNSGYIFFKLEGNSAVISDDQQGDPTGKKQFKYHIGGFGGYSTKTVNNLKTITINLTQGGIAKVRNGRNSNIHLLVNLMNVFNGPNTFSIKEHPTVMFNEYSTNIAQNFSSMFTHDHTEN